VRVRKTGDSILYNFASMDTVLRESIRLGCDSETKPIASLVGGGAGTVRDTIPGNDGLWCPPRRISECSKPDGRYPKPEDA